MSEAAPRRGIVQLVQAPRGTFRKIVLTPGQSLSLGRDERADVRIEDPTLRGAHLVLEFDAVGLHLREVGGTGALSIDGQMQSFGEVLSGGWFSAGRSTFRFFLERVLRVKPLDELSSSRTLTTLGGSAVMYSPATMAPLASGSLSRT